MVGRERMARFSSYEVPGEKILSEDFWILSNFSMLPFVIRLDHTVAAKVINDSIKFET